MKIIDNSTLTIPMTTVKITDALCLIALISFVHVKFGKDKFINIPIMPMNIENKNGINIDISV